LERKNQDLSTPSSRAIGGGGEEQDTNRSVLKKSGIVQTKLRPDCLPVTGAEQGKKEINGLLCIFAGGDGKAWAKKVLVIPRGRDLPRAGNEKKDNTKKEDP